MVKEHSMHPVLRLSGSARWINTRKWYVQYTTLSKKLALYSAYS
jgi:hypothetical protein